ncbi:MAG TPA: zinc ribbon domain-containing protein, partial [Ktedonobacterales bacterium]|nr:zinc ribbon domain-containing protein [Ktedonobacterales bacterium]
MPVCTRCGTQLSPELSSCPNCGASVAPEDNGEPSAAEHMATNGMADDANAEQVYLPAQPYIAPAQLYDSHYLHPYVPGRTIYATPSEQAPEIMPGVLGVVPEPLKPENPAQRLLLRYTPNYAADPVLGVLAGGITAVGMVLLLSLFVVFVIGPAIAPAMLLPIGGEAGGDAASVLSSNNLFVVLALEHHASFVLRSGSPGAMVALTLPITTLLVVPALSLMAGGFVAASTEYESLAGCVAARGRR